MKFRMLPLIAAASFTLLLAGCVPADPVVVPVETDAAQPIFASDEEALAAAVERYGDYFAAVIRRSNEGSDDLRDFAQFVTDEQLERELATAKDSVDRGTHTRGTATFDRPKLQQYWSNGDSGDSMIIYLCVDVTDVVVLDTSGADVTPPDRPNRAALEIEFEVTSSDQESIRIARSDVWPDQQYCL